MKIVKISLPKQARIICISDIHGCYDEFCTLLDKCGYNVGNDHLFILGDMLEKGVHNISVLQKVTELSKIPKVYIIKGNNDTDCPNMAFYDSREKFLERLKRRPYNAFVEMGQSLGITDFAESFEEKRALVRDAFYNEIKFVDELPYALETQDHIFIHAGIENRPDWENGNEWFAMCAPWFLRSSHMSEKTVICGHYPVQCYKRSNNSNLPIIDKEKRIIDIDGGAVTKWAGQLNAFIINKNGALYSYDNFFVPINADEMTVKRDVVSNYMPEYAEWESHVLQILENNDGMLLVKNQQTGKTGLIPEKFTFTGSDGKLHGGINLNAFLSVRKGERFYAADSACGYYLGIAENGQIGLVPQDHLK